MPFMPFHILGIWFRGLLSIAIIAGAIYLLKRWYDESHVAATPPRDSVEGSRAGGGTVPDRDRPTDESSRRVFRFEPGINRATGLLGVGTLLAIWAVGGLPLRRGLYSLLLRSGTPDPGLATGRNAAIAVTESKKRRREKARQAKERGRKVNTGMLATAIPESDEDPRSERTGEVHTIRRPDGSELRVECYGPAEAPPIIMTHGWGANSTEWFYPKRYMAGNFRLILWDEPGLGMSRKPRNNDYRLENLAGDLEVILRFAGRPAILVGHSIGGMITLTLCKIAPELLGRQVAGLVLVHTTHTNPVRTTKMAGFYTAIEKPVLIPMMYLTIALWPLVWLMNWLSYLNGSAHQSTHKSSFSGNETMGQLDFASRFMPHGRPDVLARGMLGMIGYDATAALRSITVPTLVIVGDLDTTTLPEAGQFISRNIPKARLETLSPAKHMGLVEHHGRFDELLVGFAARHLSRDPRV